MAIHHPIATHLRGRVAFGASTPKPIPSHSKAQSGAQGKAQSMAAEKSGAASAGRALGLGSEEKLTVTDVIRDADGSTHVRYDRTVKGLRVIGGDFVSHRDKAGKVKGVSARATQADRGLDHAEAQPSLGHCCGRPQGLVGAEVHLDDQGRAGHLRRHG